MQVKATQPGYYGCLREPGDVFEIADKDAFSEHWMEEVDPPKPEQKAKADKGKQ